MDGGFEIFLLLMFVFWILEGIAKAKQRPRAPRPGQNQQTPPEQASRGQRVPPDRGQRPPTILEMLAAELERAKETHRQTEEGQSRAERVEPAEQAPRTAARKSPVWKSASDAPTGRSQGPAKRGLLTPRRTPPRGSERSVTRRPPLSPKDHPAPQTRLVQAKPTRGEVVLRGERADAVEEFSERERVERTSDAWATGVRDAERGAISEGDRAASLEVERSASLEAQPRRVGLQRAGIKESQQTLGTAQPKVPKPIANSLDPRSLVGASHDDLRRILILREVLGPPVALREDGDE